MDSGIIDAVMENFRNVCWDRRPPGSGLRNGARVPIRRQTLWHLTRKGRLSPRNSGLPFPLGVGWAEGLPPGRPIDTQERE